MRKAIFGLGTTAFDSLKKLRIGIRAMLRTQSTNWKGLVGGHLSKNRVTALARHESRFCCLFPRLREGNSNVMAPFLDGNRIFDFLRNLERALIVSDCLQIVSSRTMNVTDISDTNLKVRQRAEFEIHAFRVLK